MPRIRISEYKAKQLILGEQNPAIALRIGDTLPSDGQWVLKVDQGIKKRFKQGLVAVNIAPNDFAENMRGWSERGFSQFIAEPFFEHESSDESYLSFERVRTGIRVLFTTEGGVDVEAHPEAMQSFLVRDAGDLAAVATSTSIPLVFWENILNAFQKNFFSFLEINPLVFTNGQAHLLDAAVLVDSAGVFFVNNSWGESDLIESSGGTAEEITIQALQKTTAASVKLNVLHPNGSLFFLLSGGGGSIVIADEVAAHGLSAEIGNYGEYSGGPSREETRLYAREVLRLLLDSTAPKKALIIAGGIANFTDIATTFEGLIDALNERRDALRAAGVLVFIRRGGPNETTGLAQMRSFLEEHQLLGSIHGSEAPLTQAVEDAIRFVKNTL